MPLYSDSNYYYSGGSSQLYSPYYSPSTGLYSSASSSSSSSPYYSSSYNRNFGGSYVVPITPPRSPSYTTHGLSSRYQPMLSTITESSPLLGSRHGGMLPLTRIHSPKVSSYTPTSTSTLGPKYIPPRPILINTADIDVSSSRYHKHATPVEEKPKEKKSTEQSSPSSSVRTRNSVEKQEQAEAPAKTSEAAPTESPDYRATRSTIKRDRAVVRLSTIRSRSKDRDTSFTREDMSNEPTTKKFKDVPQAPEQSMGWRQKLADDLAAIPSYPIKKSPGDRIRERHFIRDNKADEADMAVQKREARAAVEPEKTVEKVVVELDPVDHSIRRLSIPNCPTFHDICEDISSDKIDDDLNAGALRRRASLIQEHEQELLNQLQKSASGTFQLIHLERRGSHDSVGDEPGHKRKSKKGKKVRHKITAIVEVENFPLTPILQEKDDELPTPAEKSATPKPKFTFNVEHVEEHHEIHKIFKLPKKKSVKKLAKPKGAVALPEGFMQAKPKEPTTPKKKIEKKETFVSTAEIFTFDEPSIKESQIEGPKELTNDTTLIALENQTKVKEMQSLESPKLDAVQSLEASKSTTLFDSCASSLSLGETLPCLEMPSETISSAPAEIKKKENGEKLKEETKSPEVEIAKQKINMLKSSQSLDAAPKTIAIKPIPKLMEKSQSLNVEEPKPTVATPKPIRKAVQKSESAVDFWSEIGSRETIYMTNRKKDVHDTRWVPDEDIVESKTAGETKQSVTDKSQETCATKSTTIEKNEIERTCREHDVTPAEKKGAGNVGVSPISPKTPDTPATKTQEMNVPASPPHTSITVATKGEKTLAEKTKAMALEVKQGAATRKSELVVQTEKAKATSAFAESTREQKSSPSTPKINSGQAANKSPEQQDTKKYTAAPVVANKNTNSNKTDKTSINNAITLAKSANDAPKIAKVAATPSEQPATTTPGSPKPTATSTAKVSATTTAAAAKLAEAKVTKLTEATKKPSDDPKTATSKPINKKISPIANTKPISTTSKTSPSTGTSKSKTSPLTASAPINADQFIAVAPTKPATSPTKAKNASPTTPAKTIAASKTASDKPKATTVAATPTTMATTPTTTSSPPTTKTKPKTIAATPPTTTTDSQPVAAATNTATSASARETTEIESNTSGGNNLSKFATVSNLAQFLQDVDADLDDYIPSSAANSDEDSTDDDSSIDYSSADGCKNLSASMKKKLKQRRKKEKQAEKARFDPQKKVKIDPKNKCYVKEETPRYPLVATPRPLWKREKVVYPAEDSDESDSDEGDSTEATDDSEECTTSDEYEDDLNPLGVASLAGGASDSTSSKENASIIRMSTCSNDSGFEGGTAPSSPKKMLECDVNCHKKCERLTANLCGVNQKLIVEALAYVKRGTKDARDSPSTPPSLNPAYKIDANDEQDETSYTYSQFQKSGRFTAPATVIPRFKNYSVDDFHFLAVLGKGSFGKVLLAELRDTTYYYAVKCLKKDVVLEDDDVDSTLIERKVLALGTKHPYLCHLFCTFQTESHLFFVMEYLNGGDLMFHIQESGRFSEERARFYGAEIISGLKFLHKKGIIYRDLKLDNVLLDYEGHVRIADFGMCKLQIYLDKTADSFCGTPDYMAPEIIKGEKYNQNVDWWSFGVLLYEMLIGQSPFSGCDEDELFWSICNEIPWFPVYISAEATSILKGLLEKDYNKRVGSQYSLGGEISEHIFFRPIDWNLLDKRQMEPPFKPQVKHPLDTQYFDRVFTRERVRLTPIDKDILQSMDQKQFHGFTYTNPHITLD